MRKPRGSRQGAEVFSLTTYQDLNPGSNYMSKLVSRSYPSQVFIAALANTLLAALLDPELVDPANPCPDS